MTIDQLSRLVVTYVNRTTPQVSLSQSAPLCMIETKALFKTSLTPGRRFEDKELLQPAYRETEELYKKFLFRR